MIKKEGGWGGGGWMEKWGGESVVMWGEEG